MPICPFINQNGIQCGAPEGHKWGHGNGLLTSPRDEWHLPSSPVPAPASPPKVDESTLQKEWELKEGDPQCLWSGIHGRCSLRLGHFPKVGHVELMNGGTSTF
jgi:hypothetical protein